MCWAGLPGCELGLSDPQDVLDEVEHDTGETDLLHVVQWTFVPDEAERFLKVDHDRQCELLVVDSALISSARRMMWS